jgi:D-xylose 1-dehydrogenase (NADP+, D-xylono-1,5-lactone-forming)
MWRHSRQTALMLELLPRVGELQSISSIFAYPRTPEDDVRLVPELGGGALLDVGCYCVSASRLLAGREPERVYGEQSLGHGGVDWRFAGVLRFGEVLATFQCGFASHETRGIVAVGSEGELRAPDPWHAREARVFLNGEEHAAARVDPYRLQLENFAAAVRGEAPPLLGRADALGQARALDGLLRSAERAEPATL